MFGSIDSEQSVPRTAPIASPEHDSSLVDLMHDASNNNNRNRHCIQSVEAQQGRDSIMTYTVMLGTNCYKALKYPEGTGKQTYQRQLQAYIRRNLWPYQNVHSF